MCLPSGQYIYNILYNILYNIILLESFTAFYYDIWLCDSVTVKYDVTIIPIKIK